MYTGANIGQTLGQIGRDFGRTFLEMDRDRKAQAESEARVAEANRKWEAEQAFRQAQQDQLNRLRAQQRADQQSAYNQDLVTQAAEMESQGYSPQIIDRSGIEDASRQMTGRLGDMMGSLPGGGFLRAYTQGREATDTGTDILAPGQRDFTKSVDYQQFLAERDRLSRDQMALEDRRASNQAARDATLHANDIALASHREAVRPLGDRLGEDIAESQARQLAATVFGSLGDSPDARNALGGNRAALAAYEDLVADQAMKGVTGSADPLDDFIARELGADPAVQPTGGRGAPPPTATPPVAGGQGMAAAEARMSELFEMGLSREAIQTIMRAEGYRF